MRLSGLMSGIAYGPLLAPDGVAGGGAPGAAAEPPIVAPAAEPAPAPAAVAAEPAAAAPAADAAPAPDAAKAAPDAKPADAAAVAPAREFPPSVLDEAVKPTADAKDPAKDAPAPDKPADAKPSDKKEPAAAEAKPADAKAGDKPADAKPGDAKPAEPPAPIEYKFAFPQGVKPEDVSTEQMNAFTGILQETRTPPEAAQKFLDMHLAEVQRVAREVENRVSERQWDVFAEQQRKSREEVMADPVIGGSRHDTALKTIMSVFDAYALRDQNSKSPRSADEVAAERKQIMDDFRATGIANRASFLRFANWIGETYVKEGKPRAAPPPRQQAPNAQQRGLNRYRGTTPATAG